MAHLKLLYLGGYRAVLDGVAITGFESIKVRALLAYLATEADRTHSRESLAALLWPDWPHQSAMSNLRYCLSDLRKNIGDRQAQLPFLVISRDSLGINRKGELWIDVERFENLAVSSDLADLKEAADLYQGEFLSGFSVTDNTSFELWMLARREQLQRLALQALATLVQANAQTGRYEAAMPYAQRQVELASWHEPGQMQLIRLLALTGDRSAALAQYESLRKTMKDELGLEPSSETRRLVEAIREEKLEGLASWKIDLSQLQAALPLVTLPPEPGDAPFKGLEFFDIPDAPLFFGRENLVAQLVGLIRQMAETDDASSRESCCFLAVVGASGSGKSSIVRAGVVPALLSGQALADGHFPPEGSQGWHIHVFTPTSHPLEALAISLLRETKSLADTARLMDDLTSDVRSLHLYAQYLLAPVAPGLTGKCRLLLIIDQFEELFTLCRSEAERQSFLDNLFTAVAGGGPTQVVVVLRADFYGHCAQYPQLRRALCTRQVYIGPMDAGELRRAIEEPAIGNNWDFEPGLVELILRDIGASDDHPPEPGALPLLEHALLETWQRRSGRRLTLKGYAEAGGVHGAIARTAENVYAKLSEEQQALARRIFLRLTELGEGTQDTRRRAPLSELASLQEPATQVDDLLKILADARLVTLSEHTAEVAHEALIREWPALREWLSEDREGLHLHRHLTESAEAWDELERDPGEFYRGARLAQGLEWGQFNPEELTSLEKEFLLASQAQADREVQERQAQRQRELENAQRLVKTQRQRSLALTIGLFIAIILIGLAAWLYRTADANLGLAQYAQQTAQAEAFSRATQQARAEAESAQRATQQALAEAAKSKAEAQTQLSLSRELAAASINALNQDPQLSLLLALEAKAVSDTAEAEGALHRAVQASHLEKVLAGKPDEADASPAIINLAYSPDGALLAVVDAQKQMHVYDLFSGKQLYTYILDDELLALDEAGGSIRAGMPIAAEFYPDGSLCLEGNNWFVILDSQTGQEWIRTTAPEMTVLATDRLTGKELFRFEHTSEGNMPIYAEYTPAGIHIIVYSQNVSNGIGEFTAYDLKTGKKMFLISFQRGAAWYGGWNLAEYSPDGRLLMVRPLEEIEIWDLASGKLVNKLGGLPAGDPLGAAFSPDGKRLALRDSNDKLKVWDVESGDEILYTSGKAFAFSPDGGRLVVADANHQVSAWSLETRRVLYDFLCNPSQTASALSPDGKHLAAGGYDGQVYLCEVSPDYELRQWISDDLVLNYSYASDPELLGIASADNHIRLYDVVTGALYKIIEPLPFSVLKLFDISADGARIITMDTDYATRNDPQDFMHIWETVSGKELARWMGDCGTYSIDLSPDGNRTIWICDGVFIAEMSTEDFTWLSNEYWMDWSGFSAVRYNIDGAQIALAKADGRVGVFDSATETQIFTATLKNRPVALSFDPPGKRLAVSTAKGEVSILNTQNGELILALPEQASAVQSLAYGPDGSRLATGSADGSVILWDAESGEKILDMPRHDTAITFLTFTSQGNRLISGSVDGVARLSVIPVEDIVSLARQRVKRDFMERELQAYHLAAPLASRKAMQEITTTDDEIREIILPAIPKTSHPAPQAPVEPGTAITTANVNQLVEMGWVYTGGGQVRKISPDGKFIASVSGFNLSLYEVETMQPAWNVKVDDIVEREIAFSPNGVLIAIGKDHGDVDILRAADGEELIVLKGHDKAVSSVEFSPDGTLLATGSQDDLIKLWRMPDGNLVGTLANNPYGKGVWSIDFSPDGAFLASGSTDGKVRIWDVQRQAMVKEYQRAGWGAYNIDFSSDGESLVTDDRSQFGSGAHVLRVEDGSFLYPIPGLQPVFSPDGSMIVTRGFYPFNQDNLLVGELYFTDARDGKVITSFVVDSIGVTTMGFTEDMKYFYVQTFDGILHLWGVP